MHCTRISLEGAERFAIGGQVDVKVNMNCVDCFVVSLEVAGQSKKFDNICDNSASSFHQEDIGGNSLSE